MRLLTDTRYDYPGYHGSKAHCQLRIYGGDPDRPTIVIVTEAHDNAGTSITNAAESLATRVCRDFGLDPDTLLWIEHYRDRACFGGRPQFKERFDLVSFDRAPDGSFRHPEWRPLTKAAVERLIGAILTDDPDPSHQPHD